MVTRYELRNICKRMDDEMIQDENESNGDYINELIIDQVCHDARGEDFIEEDEYDEY